MTWRPEDWPGSPCHCGDTWCLQCTEHRDREAGADAMLAALMTHLRVTAKQNLDLAQSITNRDSTLRGIVPWQLGRDATAYLVVADYIEKGQIRPWDMGDIRNIHSNA